MKQFSQLRLANQMRDVEWDPEHKINLAFRAVELGGEVGESLNKIKKLVREQLGIRGSRTTENEIGEEIADIIITTDLLAMSLNIDLWKYVVNKFNSTSEKNNLNTRMAIDW